jgi:hypothetical protein
MTPDQEKCEHLNFKVDAKVNRVMNETSQKIGAFTLSLRCICQDCGLPFWFPGLPTGSNFTTATTDTTGFELTTPLAVMGQPHRPDPTFVNVLIRSGDTMKGHSPS